MTSTDLRASITADGSWTPPSEHLRLIEGVWQPEDAGAVSYPKHGNDLCFQVEDKSYWFAHRNRCILELVRSHPPDGVLYDLGGGNGFVCAALQREGFETVLVEPGSGVWNARKRGVTHVVRSTLEAARFRAGSLPAAGAFDVLEHIEDDTAFVAGVSALLQPGGRFYCTVPALQGLWSHEDNFAGHHRRYSRRLLQKLMESSGLRVEFISSFFAWLVAPVLLFRTMPFVLRVRRAPDHPPADRVQADHSLPPMVSRVVDLLHAWELKRLRSRRSMHLGSSLLCVARKPPVENPA